MSRESARFWRHPGIPAVDLLEARYIDHRFGKHTHDGYVFGIIERGVEEFDARATRHRAGAGQVVAVNPDTVHTGHAGVVEGWSYRTMYPPTESVVAVAAELGLGPGTPHFPQPVLDDEETFHLFRSMHMLAAAGDDLASSTAFATLIAQMLTRHSGRPGSTAALPGARPGPGRSVRQARDILHARLVDPPRLEELASAVDVAPFTLLRSFRAATGFPPHAYLNQLRVRTARHLLDQGRPPALVAAEVGFADQAHLTRHFKRQVGVGPGAYQRGRLRDGGNFVQYDRNAAS